MSKMARENCIFLSFNRRSTTSAATSSNYIAKARAHALQFITKLQVILHFEIAYVTEVRKWTNFSAVGHRMGLGT